MKILLVGDSALFRDGIASILRVRGHEVLEKAGTASQAFNLIESFAPGLVLVEVMLPDGSGLDFTRIAKARHPETRFVILTASESGEHLVKALEYGADGYLSKGVSALELLEYVAAIGRGERVISDGMRGTLFSRARAQLFEGPASPMVSPRQAQILHFIYEGLDDRAMAARMQISRNTVHYHIRVLMQKLGLHTRAQLVLWGLQEGILQVAKKA